MLKVFRGVTEFYGNSTVYISDGETAWQRLPDHNFEVENLKNDGDDIWNTSGVIVALGACCKESDAIRQLKRLLAELERAV